MRLRPSLDLPFFEDRHRDFFAEVDRVGAEVSAGAGAHNDADVDDACRGFVRALGDSGLLKAVVEAADGGLQPTLESRAICLARAGLARHDALLDFAFAMQGLGTGAITLGGSAAQRAAWLPDVARGRAIAAFALTEPQAGSDVGAMTTRAVRDGDGWRLDGRKTWISNGGIADFYTVFARTTEGRGARGIGAFIVPADAPGLVIEERLDVIAPHPLATLRFDGCRVGADACIGSPDEGFKLAMRTLDIFRPSVGAAALGMARRALEEALDHVEAREMFGQKLADFQLTQARLADMAAGLEAGELLTWRAAWLRDVRGVRTTREAAISKMVATESAQTVVDGAVQLLGGLGVKRGGVVERLYREVRALRIYEGATEVQKLIIARALREART
jgi:acyl-CoA dehydrogenase